MATYAIGDIQGCKATLDRLLAAIDYSPSRDRLWLVGDLVNRGPASLEVLRWAIAQGDAVTTVLGNHDLHLLARIAGVAPEKKRDTLDDVLAAPDRDALADWLRHQPLVHVEGGRLLVHGGLHPKWTIDVARTVAGEIEAALRSARWKTVLGEMSGPPPKWDPASSGTDRTRAVLAYLVRARMLEKKDGRVVDDFNGAPADAPRDSIPWFAYPDAAWRTHTIVFGHWAALGLSIGAHHVGLDTGCVWGKQLTAYDLDAGTVTQVKAVEKSA
jgi:bis(5'-nucleosyl)-tetraphosphatase (symmetrical)